MMLVPCAFKPETEQEKLDRLESYDIWRSMAKPPDFDAVIRAIESPASDVINFAYAALAASIGFKFIKKFLLAGLSPLQRRRHSRRIFINRKPHPSRSKFSGVALCHRQRWFR